MYRGKPGARNCGVFDLFIVIAEDLAAESLTLDCLRAVDVIRRHLGGKPLEVFNFEVEAHPYLKPLHYLSIMILGQGLMVRGRPAFEAPHVDTYYFNIFISSYICFV